MRLKHESANIDNDTVQGARKRAMDLLARREHAVAELSRKLISKGFDEACVDEALTTLVDEGLLSNARYTENYVRFRMNRGFGPVRIREELRQRGVAEGLVNEQLSLQQGWFTVAREAWHKRFCGKLPGDIKEHARQVRFLQYRGFTTEQIKQIFKESD